MLVHLTSLKEILKEKSKDESLLFFCIEDLVSNGLTLSRFLDGESIPTRQDVTQFLAAWFKFIGISADECRDWLLNYCIEVLSAISSSSKSGIRHSTKSNIKYIYGSDVSFDCRCEHNIFKALCRKSCPVYPGMLEKYNRLLKMRQEEARCLDEIQQKVKESIENQPKKISNRERYKEQFENAIKLAVELMKQGYMKKEIADELNKKGFKTRTGMKWRPGVLCNELNPYIVKPSREELDKTMAFALNLVEQGVSKAEVVRRLNQEGFKTQEGKEWTVANLALQLRKYIERTGK